MAALGGGRAAGVHHDDANTFAPGTPFHPLPEHGMTVGHVGPDDEKTFGVFDVVITGRRAVTAEGQLVGAGGAGHAEARVGIEVVCADDAFGQFVENVL